ncbi:MAG: response regulator [Acidobacteria bacterium]|nr:response regulator [Acidobacteriota bacterium]
MSAHVVPHRVAIASKTVLVADDTAFVRDRFRAALQSSGHVVSAISTGSELLRRVRQKEPIDLVVLDLRLPQAQGVSIVRALRRIDGFQAPIVVFSGTIANADEVRELGTLGVSGYINEYTAMQHIVPALASHLFPDAENRRLSPRVAMGVSVSYRVGNMIAAAVTLNVSTGGLAVRTTSPLDKGTALKVKFRLPGGKEIDAECTVVWTDRRSGMGWRFTKIDATDQAALADFVRAHFFSNRKA